MDPLIKSLPYLPPGRVILYVPDTHPLMARARELCSTHTRFCRQPTIAVIAKKDRIIAEGRNGGEDPPAVCNRKKLGIPTGQRYELCPGCDPHHHAEAAALRKATENPSGADLYLYGHWWCCESCWTKMIAAQIQNVYLVENAREKFS